MLPVKPSSPQNLPVTPFTYSFTGDHDYYAVANRVTGKRAVSHYVIGVTGRPSARIRLSSLLRNMRKDFVCTLRHLPRLLVISRFHVTLLVMLQYQCYCYFHHTYYVDSCFFSCCYHILRALLAGMFATTAKKLMN